MPEHKSTTHEESYIHIRADFNGSSPSVLSLIGKYHAATVFARKEDSGQWFASVALCWNIDQFSRRIGRQNARSHYFRSPERRFFITGPLTYENASHIVHRAVIRSKM